MQTELEELISKAREVEMTPELMEAQRVNFAYGNLKISDDATTRSEVRRASEVIRESRRNGQVVQDDRGEESA
jgi:hypothetical protein